MTTADALRAQIAQKRLELQDLESRLEQLEQTSHTIPTEPKDWKWPLLPEEYNRYSRQMIVPNFGLQGQERIRQARVLLVGAGGLGCPAAAYLAGCGVKKLGLADADEVEVSNLHRQIAHSTERVGMSKVLSAITYLKQLNPTVTYQAHTTHLTPQNAEEIVSQYDLVLDCTDHPTSRYLISDICVLLGKPLVSASAFQTSGQLLVLNSPPGAGPCYRCVFPKPPPPESVVGCGEGGIVGPVVGVMGVLQAMEAIKLMIRGGHLPQESPEPVDRISMLLYSAMADTPFRTVRMRGKRADCFACSGPNAQLTLDSLRNSLDYVQFCGVVQPVRELAAEERVSAVQLNRLRTTGDTKSLLIDVRGKEQFSVANIEGSLNLPINTVMGHRVDKGKPDSWIPPDTDTNAPIYVICRVGNDSQLTVRKLKELGFDEGGKRYIGDIEGGLKAWKKDIDPSIPFI